LAGSPIAAGEGAAPATARTPTKKRRKKKKAKLPTWVHPVVYAGVRTGTAAIQTAGIEPSMRALREVGGRFGALPFNDARLQRAIDNIRWCFPDWDEPAARAYALESYRHLFCLAAEVACVPRLLSEDGYAAFVEFGDLEKGLRVLLSGRPCLLVTGHVGNWELLGSTLAVLGFPVHALYRPLDMKPLDRWLAQSRQRRGLTLVDKFGAARMLPPIVERGDPVGFIADQNAGDAGLFVPFFNRLASAYKTIGVLAQRYNAPILCGQAMRLSGLSQEQAGNCSALSHLDSPRHLDPARDRDRRDAQRFRYRVDVLDVIEPEDWQGQPDPLFYITARYRRAIEMMVRRAPEQYLWMHRYWKSRPRHEKRDRPFPDRLKEKIAALPWTTDEDLERIVERSAVDGATWRAKHGTLG